MFSPQFRNQSDRLKAGVLAIIFYHRENSALPANKNAMHVMIANHAATWLQFPQMQTKA
jgi:hypothetical protein